MSKAIREATYPALITVGELIDELCRLPDTATIRFHCPMLEQELAFYRLRKRAKDLVETACQRPRCLLHMEAKARVANPERGFVGDVLGL